MRRQNLALGRALSLSCAAHVALAVLAVVSGWSWRRPVPPQQVLVTKLVRLGPKKAKDLLPELSSSTSPSRSKPPPKQPNSDKPAVPVAAPDAAAQKAAAQQRAAKAQAQKDTRAALERLSKRDVGDADGSAQGDSDVAQQGDRYVTEVQDCVKRNYVIEGIEAATVADKKAVVLLYIQGDGRISKHRLLQGSGNAAFDMAVSRAVRKCAKVSPPPPAWRSKLRNDGIEFEFKP